MQCHFVEVIPCPPRGLDQDARALIGNDNPPLDPRDLLQQRMLIGEACIGIGRAVGVALLGAGYSGGLGSPIAHTVQAFLDAGGPWPTEFRLRARAEGAIADVGPGAYVRQGSRCVHAWELPAVRTRQVVV